MPRFVTIVTMIPRNPAEVNVSERRSARGPALRV